MDDLKKLKCKFFKKGFYLYEDIEFLVYILLLKNRDIAKFIANRFPIILIDECQDLSYIQLSDLQFLAFMQQVLKEEMIDPSHIIVEMTESYMVKNDDMQQTLFHKIRALGIRIAMDDFGTGFSSLGVLKKAPADIVKIDKVFMKDVLTSNFDATFIRFIVTLCHDVNIKVLLEGVETKEEYEKVKTMGLDYIQGYYFGKPQPFQQFKKNCENNTSDV